MDSFGVVVLAHTSSGLSTRIANMRLTPLRHRVHAQVNVGEALEESMHGTGAGELVQIIDVNKVSRYRSMFMLLSLDALSLVEWVIHVVCHASYC